jgi:hypothetical protein
MINLIHSNVSIFHFYFNFKNRLEIDENLTYEQKLRQTIELNQEHAERVMEQHREKLKSKVKRSKKGEVSEQETEQWTKEIDKF